MIKRMFTDADGTCFADKGICIAMGEYNENCGTYECPFYKPRDCEDWVRLECNGCVELYAPEDYYSGH